jgi:hypothetical protein
MPVPRSSVQVLAKPLDRGQTALHRGGDQLHHLTGVADLGQIEHRAFNGESRRILD